VADELHHLVAREAFSVVFFLAAERLVAVRHRTFWALVDLRISVPQPNRDVLDLFLLEADRTYAMGGNRYFLPEMARTSVDLP
jgi:hypothetical protein